MFGHLKVPVRSNFPNFMFVDFSKVYAAVTYHAKPFSNPSTRSPFFFHGISRILCPPSRAGAGENTLRRLAHFLCYDHPTKSDVTSGKLATSAEKFFWMRQLRSLGS